MTELLFAENERVSLALDCATTSSSSAIGQGTDDPRGTNAVEVDANPLLENEDVAARQDDRVEAAGESKEVGAGLADGSERGGAV